MLKISNVKNITCSKYQNTSDVFWLSPQAASFFLHAAGGPLRPACLLLSDVQKFQLCPSLLSPLTGCGLLVWVLQSQWHCSEVLYLQVGE